MHTPIYGLNQETYDPLQPLAGIITQHHEKVIYHYDASIGLKAIVAIHNTTLGPALGGVRIWNYNREEEALADVLRLSKGMTYKSAVAGLDIGGAKAVLLGDVNQIKTEGYLRKYGQFIESLQGIYITAPDVNTTMEDMVHIAKSTSYVVGLPTLHGGSGDPSELTAYGTYMALKAAAKHTYGNDSLKGKTIGIQGVGKVGALLIDYLAKEESNLYITDLLPDRLQAVAKKHAVHIVDPLDDFYNLPMDIYAPCALGATIDDDTLSRLRCTIIAGAANNQLADEAKHGPLLLKKGITYVPDFVANAGGVINAHSEFYGNYNQPIAYQQVEKIYDTTLSILQESARSQMPTQDVANRLAEQRIQMIHQARL